MNVMRNAGEFVFCVSAGGRKWVKLRVKGMPEGGRSDGLDAIPDSFRIFRVLLPSWGSAIPGGPFGDGVMMWKGEGRLIP